MPLELFRLHFATPLSHNQMCSEKNVHQSTSRDHPPSSYRSPGNARKSKPEFGPPKPLPTTDTRRPEHLRGDRRPGPACPVRRRRAGRALHSVGHSGGSALSNGYRRRLLHGGVQRVFVCGAVAHIELCKDRGQGCLTVAAKLCGVDARQDVSRLGRIAIVVQHRAGLHGNPGIARVVANDIGHHQERRTADPRKSGRRRRDDRSRANQSELGDRNRTGGAEVLGELTRPRVAIFARLKCFPVDVNHFSCRGFPGRRKSDSDSLVDSGVGVQWRRDTRRT